MAAYPNLTVDELCSLFRTQYFAEQCHLERLNWFDIEFKAALGIDVYKHPFPKQLGYVKMSEDPFEVLVMRTEMDDGVKARVISDFLGLQEFKLERFNMGAQASYGEMYKAFKERATIPEKYLDAIISSRFAQHFYTHEMLETTRSQRLAPDHVGPA